MNRLVIITGKARAGKDTSLMHLQYHLHLKFQRIARTLTFAGPLKQFCMDVLGLTRNHCYGTTEEKNSQTHLLWSNVPLDKMVIEKYRFENGSTGPYMTGREVMEIFGTYICRRMFSDCWAKATEVEYVQNMSLSNVQFFVTDCRFPNEIEVFKKYNPLIVRLYRNTEERQSDAEIALDNFDWTGYDVVHIDNSTLTLEERNAVLESRVLPLL